MAAQQQASPAAERVFAIAELAEQIFLELPAQQVLVNVQRTCRQWKAVVEGSTPLQQALFFKPISEERMHYPKWPPKRDKYGDPYTHEVCTFQDKEDFNPSMSKENHEVTQHPLLDRYRGVRLIDVMQKASEAHPSASWRRQLLCQPPIASPAV